MNNYPKNSKTLQITGISLQGEAAENMRVEKLRLMISFSATKNLRIGSFIRRTAIFFLTRVKRAFERRYFGSINDRRSLYCENLSLFKLSSAP